MTSPSAPRDRDCPGRLAGTWPTRNTGPGVQFALDDLARRLRVRYQSGRTDRRASLPVRRPLFRGCVRPGQRPHFTVRSPGGNGRRPADCTPRRVLRHLRRAPYPGRLSRSAPGWSQLSCAPLPPHQPQTGFNEWHSLPVLLGIEALSLRCRGCEQSVRRRDTICSKRAGSTSTMSLLFNAADAAMSVTGRTAGRLAELPGDWPPPEELGPR